MSKETAWNLFLGAREAYLAHKSPKNQARVIETYRAVCEEAGLSEADTADCVRTLIERNGWTLTEIAA